MKIIKIGDTFHSSIRIYDEFRKAPVIIDENVSFIGHIKDTYSNILAVIDITLYDQIASSGWISLYVPASVTRNWPIGHALFDIKTIVDNKVVVTTDTVEFKIESSTTGSISQGTLL